MKRCPWEMAGLVQWYLAIPSGSASRSTKRAYGPGRRINNNNPEALANLPALRDAIFKGDIRKAEEIAGKYFLGTPPRIRSYQPLGSLLIDYEWNGSVSEYRRSLDIRSGIASTKFMVDGEPVTSNVFASAVDNVLVVEIKAGGTELLTCSFELTREKDANIQGV